MTQVGRLSTRAARHGVSDFPQDALAVARTVTDLQVTASSDDFAGALMNDPLWSHAAAGA